MEALEQEYPLGDVPATEEGRRLFAEQLAHDAFAFSRCSLWIRNPADVAALDAFVDSHEPTLLVTGRSGDGKSALLANWVLRHRQAHPEAFVFEHYVGAYGESSGAGIRARLLAAIKARLKDTSAATEDAEDPFALLEAMSVPVILVIDALNQMPDDEQALEWLPKKRPARVRLLVSALDGKAKSTLLQRKVQVHEVQPLDKERQRQLIDATLARYSKQLSPEDRQRLSDHPLSASPLFLKMVLEELRTFGNIQATTGSGVEAAIRARLDSYLQATSLPDCFGRFLQRLEEDFGKRLVTEFFALMLAAPFGLAESDATAILERQGHTRLALSALLQHLREHLALRDGRYDFFHDYLRQAAFNRYIQDAARLKPWHRHLLDHALVLGPDDPGALQDAPALVLRLGEPERTMDFLSDTPWVAQVARAGKTSAIEELFLSLKDRRQALLDRYQALPATAEAAMAAQIFRRIEQEMSQSARARAWLERELEIATQIHTGVSKEVAEVLGALADVCVKISHKNHYPAALNYQKQRRDILTQLHGEASKEVAEALGAMEEVYHLLDLKPRAMECRKKRLNILTQLHGAVSKEVAEAWKDMAAVNRNRISDPRQNLIHQRRHLKLLTKLHGAASKEVAAAWKEMAKAHEALKDFPQTLSCYQNLLDICSQLYGRTNKEVAAVLGTMARIHDERNDAPQALVYHQQRLEIFTELHGAVSKEVASVRREMARTHCSLDDYEQALVCHQLRLEIHTQLYGAVSDKVAAVWKDMALIHEDREGYPQALACLEKCAEILSNTPGRSEVDDVQAAVKRIKKKIRRQEGMAESWQFKFKKASKEVQRLFSVFPESQDLDRDFLLQEAQTIDSAIDDDTFSLPALMRRIDDLDVGPLGKVLLILAVAWPLQRFGKKAARRCLALAAARAQVFWRDKSEVMAHFLENQAWIYGERLNDYPLALACRQKLLDIHIQLHGVFSQEVARVFFDMALIHDSLREYKKELDFLERCLEIHARLHGKGAVSSEMAMAWEHKARVHVQLNEHQQALDCQKERLKVLTELHGADSNEVAAVWQDMAEVNHAHLLAYRQAVACHKRRLKILTKLQGEATPEAAKVLYTMARIYRDDLFDDRQALDCHERRLKIFTQLHGEGSKEVTGALNSMARVHMSLKEYPQALSCYQRCRENLARLYGADSDEVGEVLGSMAKAHMGLEEYPQALSCYRQSLEIFTELHGKKSSDVRRILEGIASVLPVAAQSHERSAQWGEAETCWRRLLELDIDDGGEARQKFRQQARQGLNRVLREQGRFAEANALAAS